MNTRNWITFQIKKMRAFVIGSNAWRLFSFYINKINGQQRLAYFISCSDNTRPPIFYLICVWTIILSHLPRWLRGHEDHPFFIARLHARTHTHTHTHTRARAPPHTHPHTHRYTYTVTHKPSAIHAQSVSIASVHYFVEIPYR